LPTDLEKKLANEVTELQKELKTKQDYDKQKSDAGYYRAMVSDLVRVIIESMPPTGAAHDWLEKWLEANSEFIEE
jgi:3-polyprenyl-4-hydroxybenzoate decarboxylase